MSRKDECVQRRWSGPGSATRAYSCVGARAGGLQSVPVAAGQVPWAHVGGGDRVVENLRGGGTAKELCARAYQVTPAVWYVEEDECMRLLFTVC